MVDWVVYQSAETNISPPSALQDVPDESTHTTENRAISMFVQKFHKL